VTISFGVSFGYLLVPASFLEIYLKIKMTEIPKIKHRFFWWKPQWGYRFPIYFTRGEDEFGWRNIGIITWAGSVFFRTNMCYNDECVQARLEHWKFVKEEFPEEYISYFKEKKKK